jgi:hypothetical protein
LGDSLKEALYAPNLDAVFQHRSTKIIISSKVRIPGHDSFGFSIDRRSQDRVVPEVPALRWDRGQGDANTSPPQLFQELFGFSRTDQASQPRTLPDVVQFLQQRVADQSPEASIFPGSEEGQGHGAAEEGANPKVGIDDQSEYLGVSGCGAPH